MMKKFKTKIFFLIIFFSTSFLWAGIKDNAEKIIKDNFYDPVKVVFIGKIDLPKEAEKIAVKIKQPFFADHIFAWQVLDNNNKEVKGYAMLDHVLGKVRPITFLVILNKKGIIEKTAIIKYRENYGGMVQAKRWNDQFIGLSTESSFILGEDISGISGATISVKSVTKGIHKIVKLFSFIFKSNPYKKLIAK